MLELIKDFIKDWDAEDSFYVYQVDSYLSIVADEDKMR